MNFKNKLRRYFKYLIVILMATGIVFAMYYGSIPEKYNLQIGDASPHDINATRRVSDNQATIQRASQAKADVPDVYILDEDKSIQSIKDLDKFFNFLTISRRAYYEAVLASESEEEPVDISIDSYAKGFIDTINEEMKIEIFLERAIYLIDMDEAVYSSLKRHTEDLARLVLSYNVSKESLPARIITSVNSISKEFDAFKINKSVPVEILSATLKPNMEFDKKATEAERELAYQTALDNPVMIEKGIRIISFGETITAKKYELLLQMDLINTGEFDFLYLGGVVLLIAMIIGLILLFIQKIERDNISGTKDKIAIAIAMLIPFILSMFLVNFSTLAPPVYFAAVIITSYYGFRAGIFMSIFLSFAVFPLTDFDPKFLFVAITGSVVASLFTLGMSKRNNYALIIISTTLTCFLSTVAIEILTKQSLIDVLFDSTYAVLSSSLSIILALGIMPLFEMAFNAVSPLRLIELAQPGNPILSRLFTEAPGTSQHSVMVANLCEAAAESIGANPLLARVGAYYHDIGKLDNAGMYTENQSGYNPHDEITPIESAKLITNHPESGVRMAKKYRLPPIIIKMIYEHHGTSVHKYFFNKAKEESIENNESPPDFKNYQYKTSKPSFKESAILMIADTVEAAMKSTGITDIGEAEELIRKLVKQKINEDQLTESNLSFRDIENIILAFLNVYSGHFRMRVKYPDDVADKK